MATHVALLRAVNVGGLKVEMADLREIARALGWSDVATHLNSGNLLLTASEDSTAVGARLEAALADRYAREVPVMVRTPDELASVLERLPFRGDAYDERRLQVAFLAGAPSASTPARIAGADGEEGVVDGREAFLHYPNGLGRSKLTTAALERTLGVAVTLRGVRTVAGLLERC
ncbi:MAG: DUF1697 domain-containing protein [Actinomycetota bacterium]|nr:DUF1697 domain-containing protein [Actinomycetota bacterium]